MLTSLTLILIIVPEFVINITSSSSFAILIPTIFPVLGVILYVITPLPPLFCTLYSSSSVLFPKPFSVIANNVTPLLFDTIDSIPITVSSSSKRIPSTPCADLPTGLTSFSSNVIQSPFSVTNTTLSWPSVNLTSISSSSSFNVIANNPVFLLELYSCNGVFFINPFFVAINRYLLSSKSEIGITAEIFSPASKLNKFTIAVPLAVLPASGISYPLSLYNFPLLLKNNTVSWVEVVNICLTKSSSLVEIPLIPFPPLFWLL